MVAHFSNPFSEIAAEDSIAVAQQVGEVRQRERPPAVDQSSFQTLKTPFRAPQANAFCERLAKNPLIDFRIVRTRYGDTDPRVVAAKDSYNGLDFFTILVRCTAFSAIVKSHLCLLIPSKTVLTCEYRTINSYRVRQSYRPNQVKVEQGWQVHRETA